MELKLPGQFEPATLAKLESDLLASQFEDGVNVNFSPLTFSKPMAMLVAGSYLRRWITKRRDLNLKTYKSGISAKNNVHSYLMHLGFFDYVGMKDVGNKVGVAKGNTKYLPIKEIKRSELESSIAASGESLIEAIVFLSDGLANVLSGEDIGEVKKSLSYSLREVIRNALEHSGSDLCFICGQRWANGQSEIAVIDEGFGIYETLSSAYNIDENQALTEEIKPGVSRTNNMTKEENSHGNSGFGLFVLSELGNSFGWFCIGSGTKTLMCRSGSKELSDLPFQGTFVGVHITSIPKNFSGVLHDIVSLGEAEAKREGRNGMASEISKSV